MKACIYARTCRAEKRHTTTKIEHQVAFCLEQARRFNLTVEPEHIFTDVELGGDLLPSCWISEGEPSRPALAGLIAAIEEERVTRVIVRRIEKLGTASLVLEGLRDFFTVNNVHIVGARETLADPADATAQFALSILRPLVQFDTDDEAERRESQRKRKLEEIQRLRAKLSRLEIELAAL